ncbi:MAG: DUF488 domain-containing protein [Nitriliruptorales bacterium]|nr:DUF488 domain-containing protein [Nitriliruptorales bacterium]
MILTVGHSAHPARRFATLLREAGVGTVVDVRRYPGSRRHPQFRRSELERWLPQHGISYRFEGDRLGGQRDEHDGDRHPALLPGLAGYADHMTTASFTQAADELAERAAAGTVAVMCAEADPTRCHRWLLSDALALLRGLDVLHLGPDGSTTPHAPSSAARVDAGQIVYDVAVDRPLPF